MEIKLLHPKSMFDFLQLPEEHSLDTIKEHLTSKMVNPTSRTYLLLFIVSNLKNITKDNFTNFKNLLLTLTPEDVTLFLHSIVYDTSPAVAWFYHNEELLNFLNTNKPSVVIKYDENNSLWQIVSDKCHEYSVIKPDQTEEKHRVHAVAAKDFINRYEQQGCVVKRIV